MLALVTSLRFIVLGHLVKYVLAISVVFSAQELVTLERSLMKAEILFG